MKIFYYNSQGIRGLVTSRRSARNAEPKGFDAPGKPEKGSRTFRNPARYNPIKIYIPLYIWNIGRYSPITIMPIKMPISKVMAGCNRDSARLEAVSVSVS